MEENDRPFCQAATERGILLAPGDCFDAPSHFRLGFAAAGDNFSKALDRFGVFVKSWSAENHGSQHDGNLLRRDQQYLIVVIPMLNEAEAFWACARKRRSP